MQDDDAVKKLKTHEVGMNIDTMSVDELDERIALLHAEVDRLKAARASRASSKMAAEAFFKSKD